MSEPTTDNPARNKKLLYLLVIIVSVIAVAITLVLAYPTISKAMSNGSEEESVTEVIESPSPDPSPEPSTSETTPAEEPEPPEEEAPEADPVIEPEPAAPAKADPRKIEESDEYKRRWIAPFVESLETAVASVETSDQQIVATLDYSCQPNDEDVAESVPVFLELFPAMNEKSAGEGARIFMQETSQRMYDIILASGTTTEDWHENFVDQQAAHCP